ncbi:MAG: hypothetical protein HC822_26530 [Oscillochloris sp.]|nr:hypothetical protein [Oscillochloris sp.]
MARMTQSVALLVITLFIVGTLVPAQPARAQAQADLYITQFSISPEIPVAGANATYTIEVTNQGQDTAFGFVVQWRQDQNSLTGPSTYIDRLSPGEKSLFTFEYAYPQPGTYLSVAVVDTANSVPESNEVNNLQILPVVVDTAFIDLIVESITFVPAKPVQDRVAVATVRVKNQGNTAAGGFLVRWSPTPLATPLTKYVGGLGFDESTTVSFDFTYQFPGTFQTSARVDSGNSVRERDEGNNDYSRSVTVDPPRPDLVVTAITLDPPNPVQNATANATVEVRNIGNTAAGEFMVEWQPAPLAAALVDQVNGLAVNETKTVTFSFIYRFPGTFVSTATVDSTNRERELDEDNNTRTRDVEVLTASIDLVISDIELIEDEGPIIRLADVADQFIVQQGRQFTVRISVQNRGLSPAGKFVLEWNPDADNLLTNQRSTVSTQIEGLGPGEVKTVSFDFAYPEEGNFRTIAKADAFNAVRETNEDNNLRLLYLTATSGIDLRISNFVIEPGSPIRNTKTIARITVRNDGIYPSGPFSVQWKPVADAGFARTAAAPSINPGATTTVELEGTYLQADTFTSLATADIFNQVTEINELNNTATRNVTVQPRATQVTVDFTNTRIFGDDLDGGLNGDGDFLFLYLVLDPGATCSFSVLGEDISFEGAQCRLRSRDLGPNDGFNPDVELTVNLVESFPLVLGVIGIEDDINVGCVFGFGCAENAGTAFSFWSSADLPGVPGDTIDGEEGDCDGGRCFQVTYTLDVEPPPPAYNGSAGPPPVEKVLLPDGLARLLSANAVLPEGVSRNHWIYLPQLNTVPPGTR